VGHDLVYLATAPNQPEAAALRAYLEAHGIHAYVQGEHHSAMLGPLGAFAIELRILVAERDLETARELLEAYYGAEPVDDEFALAAGEGADEEDEVLAPATPRSVSPGRAAIFSIVPGFGLGHILTGAAGRGLVLMSLEVLGIMWMVSGELYKGLAVVAVAIHLDLLGSTLRARDQANSTLPTARLHRGERS
jgi:hypothetical protein